MKIILFMHFYQIKYSFTISKIEAIEKQIQVSQSKFSSFRLNETKTQIIVSDESGVLTLVDTKNLQIIKHFENMILIMFSS